MKNIDGIESFKETEKCLKDFDEMLKLIEKYSLIPISKPPIYEMLEHNKCYPVNY